MMNLDYLSQTETQSHEAMQHQPILLLLINFIFLLNSNVIGVMKMGNIVTRAGF